MYSNCINSNRSAYFVFFSWLYIPNDSATYRMPAIMVSASLVMLIYNNSEKFNKPIVKNLDYNCMGIYIFNQIIVYFLLSVSVARHYLSIHPYCGPLIIFTLSFIIPWGLSLIVNHSKYLSWINGSINPA